MSLIRVLRLPHRSRPLNNFVRTPEESWETLDEALWELGLAGWEIHFPIYGPSRHQEDQGNQQLQALILINREATELDELSRQFERAKQQVRAKEALLQEKREALPQEKGKELLRSPQERELKDAEKALQAAYKRLEQIVKSIDEHTRQ